MSTDPTIEPPANEEKSPSDEQNDGEQHDGDDREDQPQPKFQRVADEIGRRFREALDRLA